MIEFEVIQSIKITPLTEEAVRELVLAEIQKQIPEAHINSVEFVTKRNPNRIELHVDAQYGKPESVVSTPRGGITLAATPDKLQEAINTKMIEEANKLTEKPVVEEKKSIGNTLMEKAEAAKKDPKDTLIEEVIGKPDVAEPEKKEEENKAINVADLFAI